MKIPKCPVCGEDQFDYNNYCGICGTSFMKNVTSSQFTYSRGQLELLSSCIDSNDELSSALLVFFDTTKIAPTLASALNWLRHAEKIKADPRYIARLFDEKQEVISTVVCRAA